MFTVTQGYHHSTPIPKRTHKKCSTGCRACKARKVKCDEKKPVCGKCAIHFSNIDKCDYGPSTKRTRNALAATTETGPANKLANLAPTKREPSPLRLQKPNSLTGPCQVGRAPLGFSDPRSMSLWKASYSTACCKCPCHVPEYSEMLSDAIFGICRICGNLPSLTSHVSECIPIASSEALRASKIDPFFVLPTNSSPSVHALIYHWVNTLALFPTKIHSQYCTNTMWLTTAISNSALFNVTLYVCALHVSSLRSLRETAESIYYKQQTVKCLNECLDDGKRALSDETIATVLLLMFSVCVTGEKREAEAHIQGFKQMINLRGGISQIAIDGVFLHMLCTTNHLTAVLEESAPLRPLDPVTFSSPDASSPSASASASAEGQECGDLYTSPLWKPFATEIGFHVVLADVLHELGYLYAVVNAFTTRLLPHFRGGFLEVTERIQGGRGCEGRDERMI